MNEKENEVYCMMKSELLLKRAEKIFKSNSITVFKCEDELKSVKDSIIGSLLSDSRIVTRVIDKSDIRAKGKNPVKFNYEDLVLMSDDCEFNWRDRLVQDSDDLVALIDIYSALKNAIYEYENIRYKSLSNLSKIK